jgi:hypothetical protein
LALQDQRLQLGAEQHVEQPEARLLVLLAVPLVELLLVCLVQRLEQAAVQLLALGAEQQRLALRLQLSQDFLDNHFPFVHKFGFHLFSIPYF